MTKKRFSVSALCATVLGMMIQVIPARTAQAKEYFKINNGQLERPTGFREWVYVGAPVTPNDLNNGKAAFPEFHNVYMDPESWAHWKKRGDATRATRPRQLRTGCSLSTTPCSARGRRPVRTRRAANATSFRDR